jgi:hypothetical protein
VFFLVFPSHLSFNFESPLFSWRSSSSCLVFFLVFPSRLSFHLSVITCFRRRSYARRDHAS